MSTTTIAHPDEVARLAPLDRLAIGYLTLPLGIFLVGWFEWWIAVPLLACMGYALKPLVADSARAPARLPVTPLQIVIAVAVGCVWAFLGGADHLLFANPDWHVRDAVLHDLVVSPWPVGYGPFDGEESLLRAPLGFYLPAALLGKVAGLSAAHIALGFWTALGAALFLLQVLSLTPSRLSVALAVAAIVVLFSGMDIVGALINDGPRFRTQWNITMHIEWWAGKYQYSSMSTQLFWVPNHALGGWLLAGLLCRHTDDRACDSVLPIAVVALALWSPLAAIGIVPFVLWKVGIDAWQGRGLRWLQPRLWAPALADGLIVAGYLVLDPGRIPRGMSISGGGIDAVMDLLMQAQFFILEAGFIGAAIYALNRSAQVAVALVFLAILPCASFGPGNDLVMRSSIPSIAILAIGACVALFGAQAKQQPWRRKAGLWVCLLVGAVTPIAEIARAVILPSWPLNMQATLIGTNCGGFPAHYVARLGGQTIRLFLRAPHRIALGPLACDNPGHDLLWGGIVQ